jgi:hypothetical protein
MEVLNRYIGGERKRAQATDLRGIENSYAQYRLIAHGSLAAAARHGEQALTSYYTG